jgi:U3 small nucleolar RNA-associated protein 25
MAANDEVLKARKAARKAEKVGAEDAADDEAAASSSSPKGRRSDKARKPSSAKTAKDDEDSDDEDLELRDRGFAKTRLLLVVPMRHQALQYLTIINGVLGSRDRVGRERFAMFSRDFSEIDEVVDPKFKKRQEDYRKQFAGNINDTFCVGASLRASGMSVYTHVLNSDLIVCSPLGLRRRVSKDADVLVSLSSIEVAVIDQASTLMMQNWEHVVELMKLTNKMPSDTTEGLSDLRRVYPWALEGKASEHRQTVAISSIAHATINGFLRVGCHRGNRGFAKMNCDQVPGVLPVITHGIRQHFMRFKCDSLASLDDTRMEYFKNVVFPSQVKPLVDRNVHTILLVPSSFDFFKVRVFLDEQLRGSFAELTEHTSTKKQRKALGQFSSLERPLLVMTERFYFFKRYFVKHAEALVCYSPPLFPHFYAAFVNNLAHESTNATVVCPFTRYDALELQRVLGTARANAVLTRPTDSFIFASTSKNLL